MMGCLDELLTSLAELQSQKEALQKQLLPQGQLQSSEARAILVQNSQSSNVFIREIEDAIQSVLSKCNLLAEAVAAHPSLWACLHVFIDRPVGRLFDIGNSFSEFLRLKAANLVSFIIKRHLELTPKEAPSDQIQSSEDFWDQCDMDQLESLLKQKTLYEQAEKRLVENLDKIVYLPLQSLLATKQPHVHIPASSLGQINPDSMISHDSLQYFIQAMAHVAIILVTLQEYLAHLVAIQT